METAFRSLSTQAALASQYPATPFSNTELSTEAWKVVASHPKFEISTLGRLRRVGSTKFKKPWIIRLGYRVIQVGERRTVVHALVAEAFLPNPDLKPHINHKDLDKSNNRLTNLEWNTVKENNEHATLAGARRVGKAKFMAARFTPSGVALASAKRKLGKIVDLWTTQTTVA